MSSDCAGGTACLMLLPAPKDADISFYIRTYWPKQEVLNDSWQPPAVKKM